MGNIGEPVRKIDLEPFPEEAPAEPAVTPAPAEPVKEPEPAGLSEAAEYHLCKYGVEEDPWITHFRESGGHSCGEISGFLYCTVCGWTFGQNPGVGVGAWVERAK